MIRVIVELEGAPAVEAASLGSLQSAQATALRGQESTIQGGEAPAEAGAGSPYRILDEHSVL